MPELDIDVIEEAKLMAARMVTLLHSSGKLTPSQEKAVELVTDLVIQALQALSDLFLNGNGLTNEERKAAADAAVAAAFAAKFRRDN